MLECKYSSIRIESDVKFYAQYLYPRLRIYTRDFLSDIGPISLHDVILDK